MYNYCRGNFCAVQATDHLILFGLRTLFISIWFTMSAVIRSEIQFNSYSIGVLIINVVKNRIFGFLKIYWGCVPNFVMTKKSCKTF